jgi:hypothetical protein
VYDFPDAIDVGPVHFQGKEPNHWPANSLVQPATDRADISTGSVEPKGLELSFNVMTTLAVIDYPFEYDEGIVLKGYSTVLVPTSKSYVGSKLVVQWHFAASERHLRLSDFTTKEYQIWNGDEKPTIERVSSASRSFLGWCSDSIIALGMDPPPEEISRTTLPKVGSSIRFKNIVVGATVGRAPVSVTAQATFELQEGTQRHTRDRHFHQLIEDARKQPTLLYAADEDRGWLVPKLSVIHCMAFVYTRENEMDPPPKALRDPADTRKVLLGNSEFRFYPRGVVREYTEANSKLLKDLFLELQQGLEWAEEHARRRTIASRLFSDCKIYGFEFWDLATQTTDCDMKSFALRESSGGWIKLLDNEALRGVIFCKGLGEAIMSSLNPASESRRCGKCRTVPCGQSYLAATACCLQELARKVGSC